MMIRWMVERTSAHIMASGFPQSPRQSVPHVLRSACSVSRRPCHDQWDLAQFFSPPNGAFVIAPSSRVPIPVEPAHFIEALNTRLPQREEDPCFHLFLSIGSCAVECANNLLFCSNVPQALAPLAPRIRPAPFPLKLNRFDEATQPEVTMTESHSRCASRG